MCIFTTGQKGKGRTAIHRGERENQKIVHDGFFMTTHFTNEQIVFTKCFGIKSLFKVIAN